MLTIKIKDFLKSTLIDYPGEIAVTIFTGGCNFRCSYCQNPELISNNTSNIPEDIVFKHLNDRKKWLTGVCITGGEPCLQKDLSEFISKIKSMGFKVKLDTNGTNPALLKQLIDNKLLDYIAMDIKAPLDKYNSVTNVNVDINSIKKSVDLIKNSCIDYEFRTTIVPKLLSKEDLIKIFEWVKGAKKYYLQQFRPNVVLDKKYEKEKSYKPNELKEFIRIAKPFFQICEVRGI